MEVLKPFVEAAADNLQFPLAGLLGTLYFCSNMTQPLPELLGLFLQISQVSCVLHALGKRVGNGTAVMIILIQVGGISPFALAILRYVHIRDLGNVCNSIAQPSQTLWDRTRVARPPLACQNWTLDSLLLICYWDTVQPHNHEAKITLPWICFGFTEKEQGEGIKPQRKRENRRERKVWGREKGTWSKERKAESELIQILMLVWN